MKRRILALILALVMAVGLALPASAEGLDGTTTFGGDGAPVVIIGDGVTTPPPADTDTPTTGDSVPTPPTTGDSTPTPGDSTPTPLGMAPLGDDAPVVAAENTTASNVKYLDKNGNEQTCPTATVVKGSTAEVTWGSRESSTPVWYVVSGSVTIDETVTVDLYSDVHLILADGATLRVNGKATETNNNTHEPALAYGICLLGNLTIYAQSATGENIGKLIVIAEKIKNDFSSGIRITSAGSLTINGGVINATGGAVEDVETWTSSSYGICAEGPMTINGGTVTATGGEVPGSVKDLIGSHGIYVYNDDNAVTIKGGEVTATGYKYGVGGESAKFESGTLIAKGAGTSGKAIETAPTLSGTYYWRTAASGDYNTTAYSYNSSDTYVELTTQPSGGGYLSYKDWDEINKKLVDAAIAANSATEVAGHYEWGEEGKETWYYVKERPTDGHLSMNGTVTVKGTVNLILCDGADLTVNDGIKVGWGSDSSGSGGTSNTGASLTIYGQTNQTGKLVANAGSNSGGINVYCSSLTVNGGVIQATGSASGNESKGIYIIGSSSDPTLSSSMTVNSGKVTATGNTFNYGESSGIRLKNGTPTLTINGGEVEAIGGTTTDADSSSYGIHAGEGTVNIIGGTVIAKRAADSSGQAVFSTTLNLPTIFWWRTAETGDSAGYKTQNRYTDNALEGEYFELTTTPQSDAEGDKDAAVPYVDESSSSKKCEDYIVLRNSSGDVTLTSGWYVVNSDVTIGGTLTINGKVHLILCNGAKLTVNKGVKVDGSGTNAETNRELTIYGQDGQTGKLVANGTADVNGGFGISSPGYGKLTINGGIIEATGANDTRSVDSTEEDTMKGVVDQSYGIHAMYLVINGGKVKAKGGKAVGVPAPNGDGSAYSCGINASEMTVTGGKVEATGGEATGNGNVVMSCGINASEMTVTGGEIEATGGTATNTTGASATSVGIYATRDLAIGGSGKVTAKGGTAVAGSGSATSNGIEAGSMTVGSVSVAYAVGDDTPGATTGAVVNATGGAANVSSGIVVGSGISINSGTVTATGGVAGRSIGVVSDNEISVAGDATLTATGGSSTEDLTVEESYGIVGVRLRMGDLETSGNAEVTATGGTATKSCGIEVIDVGERNDTPMVLLNGGKLTAIGANYGINVLNWGGSAAAYALDDGSTEDTGASQGTVTIMKGTLIADATGTGHGLDLDKGNGESYSLVCPAAYWWRINKAVNGYRQFPGNAYVHNDLNDYVEITTEGEGLPLLPGGETHKHTRRQNTAVADLIPTPDKTDVASPETFDAGIAVYAVMGVMSATASAAWIGRRRK